MSDKIVNLSEKRQEKEDEIEETPEEEFVSGVALQINDWLIENQDRIPYLDEDKREISLDRLRTALTFVLLSINATMYDDLDAFEMLCIDLMDDISDVLKKEYEYDAD